MKKIAFIDHSFHIKSTATKFLIDIFKENYETEVFWDESWKTGKKLDLRKIRNDGYNVLVLFQMLNYDTKLIKKLGFEDVIIIPMYDAVFLYKDYQWKPFSSFKFINFSKTLHDKLTAFGIKSHYCQYVPQPELFSEVEHDGLNGFFWQRINHISWYKVKSLIEGTTFDRFHIHGAIDPGHYFSCPLDEDISKFNITVSEWFEKREDFQQVLQRSNVFFAPRQYEGIGMSFLEAMAKGMCVVAPDLPTMNEYIEHGVTGLLYDPYDPVAMEFSNTAEIGKAARNAIITKHKLWKDGVDDIISFIESDYVYDINKINIPDKTLKEAIHDTAWKIYRGAVPEFVKPLMRKVYYALKG